MICVKLAVKSKHDQKTLKKKKITAGLQVHSSLRKILLLQMVSPPLLVWQIHASPTKMIQQQDSYSVCHCIGNAHAVLRILPFFSEEKIQIKKKNSQEKLNWAMMVVKLHFLLSVIQMCSSRHIWWFFKHGKFTSTQ